LPADERRDVLARFRDGGGLQSIASVACLTEGWDAPRCEVAVLCRGAQHVSTYLQIVGRVLRPSPGKRSALLLDLVGAYHDHGAPTLDRMYSLEGEPIRLSAAPPAVWQCKHCGAVTEHAPADRRCPRCGQMLPPPKVPRVSVRQLDRQVVWTCACGQAHYITPRACSSCGAKTPRFAKVQQDSPEKRRAYRAMLEATASARGYKYGWVMFKYRAKYGEAP
jgi:superfamily II DNA or RNA helicase